jgi:membrane protein implicated in regulation of membrane protease activity
MTLEWWHWAGLGLVLMISELVVPAFVLVWFGLGALLVAVALSLCPTLELVPQLLIWIVASLAMVVLWFKVFKPRLHKTLSGRSSAEAIGEVGLLVRDIDTFQKAQVRFQKPMLGSEVWECIADTHITAGTRVKVVSVEGSLLKITTA